MITLLSSADDSQRIQERQWSRFVVARTMLAFVYALNSKKKQTNKQTNTAETSTGYNKLLPAMQTHPPRCWPTETAGHAPVSQTGVASEITGHPTLPTLVALAVEARELAAAPSALSCCCWWKVRQGKGRGGGRKKGCKVPRVGHNLLQ